MWLVVWIDLDLHLIRDTQALVGKPCLLLRAVRYLRFEHFTDTLPLLHCVVLGTRKLCHGVRAHVHALMDLTGRL